MYDTRIPEYLNLLCKIHLILTHFSTIFHTKLSRLFSHSFSRNTCISNVLVRHCYLSVRVLPERITVTFYPHLSILSSLPDFYY